MSTQYVALTARDAYDICFACKRGEIDSVLKLLADDPDLDICVEDDYPFRAACEHGHLNIIKFLLVYSQVNAAACDNYALKHAALNGHLDVVQYLLKNCPTVDPSAENNYAIRWATHCGHYKIAKILAENDRVSETWDFVMPEIDEMDESEKTKCCGCVII